MVAGGDAVRRMRRRGDQAGAGTWTLERRSRVFWAPRAPSEEHRVEALCSNTSDGTEAERRWAAEMTVRSTRLPHGSGRRPPPRPEAVA